MSISKTATLHVISSDEPTAMGQLHEISTRIDGDEKRYRAILYKNIADVCTVAKSINGPHDWMAFKNDTFWSDKIRRSAKPSDKLQLAFDVAFRNVEPRIRSEYRLAAEYLLKDAVPEDLPGEFRRKGGIRAVLNESRQQNHQARDLHAVKQNSQKIIVELDAAKDTAELLSAKKGQFAYMGLEIVGKLRNKILCRVVHFDGIWD